MSETCTIGVASGTVTTDGRPLIWKSRDVFANVYVHYHDEFPNKFIGVGNENSEYIWMGVNEHGFAILNSLADFPDEGNGRMGNGDTMKHALANFSTIVEFEAFLDSTNITGRETHANMAVLDSTGAAIMYEVSENNYWIFDTADAEDGYIVRAIFAFNGGGTTSPNYEASKAIIGDLVADNNLNISSILHNNIREFSDHYTGEHIPVPYENRWEPDLPFGYIQAQGVCNNGNGSAVIIQGTLPDEPVAFSTMWTLLGQPSSALSFPCFPVGPPPLEANNEGISELYYQAYANQNILFGYIPTIYVDTYKLINYNDTGYWTQIFPQEDEYISQIDSLKNYWLENSYEIEDILNTQNDIAIDALSFLQNAYIETEVIPDFRADIRYGIPGLEVQFEETSIHFPGCNYWQWDFDNDGTIDFDGIDTVWTYTETGDYTVDLEVGIGEDSYPIQKENYINIFNSVDEIIDVEPDSLIFDDFDEAINGLPIQITNLLDIPIYLDEIWAEPGSFYHIGHDLEELPVFIPENGSVQVPIKLIFYTNNREFVEDTLFINVSNGIYSFPVYIDESLNCDADNLDISQTEFNLSNFPNPFSSETTISFSCYRDTENTEIIIYNIKGQKIETFKNLQINNSSNQQIVWNAENYPSGIYFYKLNNQSGNSSKVRKMVLLK